jgi:hypothetical protein
VPFRLNEYVPVAVVAAVFKVNAEVTDPSGGGVTVIGVQKAVLAGTADQFNALRATGLLNPAALLIVNV